MMEKTPSSCIFEKIRGERTWMPQKASEELKCGQDEFGLPSWPARRPQSWPCCVEEQMARSFAVLHGQSGKGVVFGVKMHHAVEIDGAEDIDVVKEKWLVFGAAVFKKPGSLLQAAAGVEQDSSRETSIRMPKLSLASR